MTNDKVTLTTKVIDGRIYIGLESLVAAFRARAREYIEAARNSHPSYRSAYYTVVQELEYRADQLEFANIAYNEEPR